MRVLIVDDSVLIRSILKEVFSNDREIEVIGEAPNGKIAIEKNNELKPDLVIMDINMPVMDGITASKHIMSENPVPIFIFSTEVEALSSFEALQIGVVDVLKKPNIGDFNDPVFYSHFKELLLNAAAGKSGKSNLIREHSRDNVSFWNDMTVKSRDIKLVVMGASTGGPIAVNEIIKRIPADFPLPIVLVQHLESGFDNEYVSWLNQTSNIKVKIAGDREVMRSGILYVAPSDMHLKVSENKLIYDDGPKELNQKPSVNVLFSSAARIYREKLLGILLTGMGRDGANGCLEIIRNNGTTIVQDETTSAIFGMPKAAIELDAATYIQPLLNIPEILLKIVGE